MKLTKLASSMLAKVLPLLLEGSGKVEVHEAGVIDVGKGPAPLTRRKREVEVDEAGVIDVGKGPALRT